MSIGIETVNDLETFSNLECKLFGVYNHRDNIARYIDYKNDKYKEYTEKLLPQIDSLQLEIKLLKETIEEYKDRNEELKGEITRLKQKKCSSCGKLGHNKKTCPLITRK